VITLELNDRSFDGFINWILGFKKKARYGPKN
jgi:hypothetical protein